MADSVAVLGGLELHATRRFLGYLALSSCLMPLSDDLVPELRPLVGGSKQQNPQIVPYTANGSFLGPLKGFWILPKGVFE